MVYTQRECCSHLVALLAVVSVVFNTVHAGNIEMPGCFMSPIDASNQHRTQASKDIVGPDSRNSLDFIRAKKNPNQVDENGQTPLHVAAIGNNHVLVETLLDAGADPNQANKNGQTSLHFAVFNFDDSVVVVEALLKANANPSKADSGGETPLHYAVAFLTPAVIYSLLNARADPNKADKNGKTPLHIAATFGRTAAAEALLNARAEPNKADKNGQTPLHIAARFVGTAVVEVLLNAGAEPNKSDKNGQTPLNIAWSGDTAIANTLSAAIAARKLADENDQAFSHIAAEKGDRNGKPNDLREKLPNFPDRNKPLVNARQRDKETLYHHAASLFEIIFSRGESVLVALGYLLSVIYAGNVIPPAIKEKLIIDTDLGVDDALAIYCALNDDAAEVQALTTVFGHAAVETTTENALRLLEIFERDILVHKGASSPLAPLLSEHPSFSFAHGENGLGNIPPPKANKIPKSSNAAEYIVDMANAYPGKITLVALGPLTNLALALQLDPSIERKIKKVVLMGGNLPVSGNVPVASRSNIFCDPQAADSVFGAFWPVTVVGQDVTFSVIVTPEFFKRLERRSPEAGVFFHARTHDHLDCYRNQYNVNGFPAQDATTVAYALHPEWFKIEREPLRVRYEENNHGMMDIHEKNILNDSGSLGDDRPMQSTAVKVNSDKVLSWMESL